jgi:L-lactate dehydrogenase complex protein LldE
VSTNPIRVQLFITCLADQFFPEVGECAVRVLRRLGVEVTFDSRQTCCGQPAFNSGYREQARQVAESVLDLFSDSDYVVSLAGSCSTMIRVFYPEIFANEPARLDQAKCLGRRSYEFSEFLVKVLGVEDVGAEFHHRVTYHDSCHLLRELGVEQEPRKLLRAVRGLDLTEMDDHRLCCGFGGTFSVKFPEVSAAMGQDKLDAAARSGAEYLVACDSGCLMHLAGLIQRRGLPLKTLHLAQVLAGEE